MEYLHCHEKGAKYKGQNVKSRDPYIATSYYYCPHCFTDFSIDKTEGDIHSPSDPAIVLRRVLKDIAQLPKDHLKLIRDSVTALKSSKHSV